MTDELVSFVFNDSESIRLDKFLSMHHSELSRSRLQSLIQEGFVSINDEMIQKPARILEKGDKIVLSIPPAVPVGLFAESIPLEIIFENSDLLVVNKPAGMVVHPAPGHSGGTLVNAILAHAPDIQGIGGELRPGIVHRLDKDTSGLILVAKNEMAHRWLQDQFRLRKVKKTYLALLDGAPPTLNGRVEASIGRDLHHRKQMAVVTEQKGRTATSEFQVLEKLGPFSLVEVHPITGRTHQIRLHMAFLGCSVVGDSVYGRKKNGLGLQRHFLHSARLWICLPGEKTPRIFEAPLPPELEDVLKNLRAKYS